MASKEMDKGYDEVALNKKIFELIKKEVGNKPFLFQVCILDKQSSGQNEPNYTTNFLSLSENLDKMPYITAKILFEVFLKSVESTIGSVLVNTGRVVGTEKGKEHSTTQYG